MEIIYLNQTRHILSPVLLNPDIIVWEMQTSDPTALYWLFKTPSGSRASNLITVYVWIILTTLLIPSMKILLNVRQTVYHSRDSYK